MANLTQADIRAKADEWAKLTGKIEVADIARNAELHPLQVAYEKKTSPIISAWNAKIDPLQAKADVIETEIIGWLKSQKKSVTVEGSKAIAKFFKGKKESPGRIADVKKFLGYIQTKGEAAVHKCMTVVLKDAEKLIGKVELDKICTKPKKDVAEATLTRK